MGLLDDVMGQAQQHLGKQAAGGNTADLLSGLTQLLGGQGGAGGLAGLVQLLNQGGLGNIIQSWISTGQNLPISPAQLQQVLGQGPLQNLAAKTGLAPEALSQQLSQLLPQVVDKLTPEGKLPSGDLMGDAMGMLKKFL